MLPPTMASVVAAQSVAADAGRPQMIAAIFSNESLRGEPGLIAIWDP